MNNLPEPIIDKIYRYKHQLEFRHVMNELIDKSINTMYLTRQALIRYLRRNINEIEWVILNDSRRMCILDYLKIICRSRCRIFN